MMVRSEPVGPSSSPDDDKVRRQSAWRQASVQPLRAARKKRLEALRREQDAIMRATAAYEDLDTGDVPLIMLRGAFIGRTAQLSEEGYEDATQLTPASSARRRRRGRQPLMRLVYRHSNALALYLTAVYVAHLETRAGAAFTNDRRNVFSEEGKLGWADLAGMTAPRSFRARRARVNRALDGVVASGLANINAVGEAGRYEKWALLSDDGQGGSYRVPSERDPGVVRLPPAFFYNGWHLVLEPGEIAMLLILMHRGRALWGLDHGPWVSLRLGDKRGYSLSGEMYLHAQQLREFGLVEFQDQMENRRRGKIKGLGPKDRPLASSEGQDLEEKFSPVPYDYRASRKAVFDEKALTVVRRTLEHLPIPHRLDSAGNDITAQELVRERMAARKLRARR